jgi:hypothetical protein
MSGTHGKGKKTDGVKIQLRTQAGKLTCVLTGRNLGGLQTTSQSSGHPRAHHASVAHKLARAAERTDVSLAGEFTRRAE